MRTTSGRWPAEQPSAGGSLPNDVFSELLEPPTPEPEEHQPSIRFSKLLEAADGLEPLQVGYDRPTSVVREDVHL
jgi:hypothetical protein